MDDVHPCPILQDGKPCIFATAQNTCSYGAGSCQTVTPRCAGCPHVEVNPRGMRFCTIFFSPADRWADGDGCLFAPPGRRSRNPASRALPEEDGLPTCTDCDGHNPRCLSRLPGDPGHRHR